MGVRNVSITFWYTTPMDEYKSIAPLYHWFFTDQDLDHPESYIERDELLSALKNARILDASCGIGLRACGLAIRGNEVVGADLSAGMLHQAQELANRHGISLPFHHSGWLELPELIDKNFDYVLCMGNSISHVNAGSPLEKVMEAFSRVVAPSGHVIITSRNWDHMIAAKPPLDKAWTSNKQAGCCKIYYRWNYDYSWRRNQSVIIGFTQGMDEKSYKLEFTPVSFEQMVSSAKACNLTLKRTNFSDVTDFYYLEFQKE
jgi:ubiquinone/menaquinone biosynthesis C-methylase UbiE